MNRWIFIFLLPIAFAGCVTAPKPLAVGSFAEVTPSAALSDNFVGQRVRWGGSIANSEPGKNETCFEIVSHPLGSDARPLATDMTWGRFIACAPGFYDPEVYSKGREVTVVGNIQSTAVRKLGEFEYEYRYPQINAETVYLWPRLIPYFVF
jgi:outer membrane lipoprotein